MEVDSVEYGFLYEQVSQERERSISDLSLQGQYVVEKICKKRKYIVLVGKIHVFCVHVAQTTCWCRRSVACPLSAIRLYFYFTLLSNVLSLDSGILLCYSVYIRS